MTPEKSIPENSKEGHDYGCIYALAAAAWFIFSCLIAGAIVGTDNNNGAVLIIVAAGTFFLGSFLFWGITSTIAAISEFIVICPHGTRGGQAHNKCRLCNQERALKEALEKQRVETEKLEWIDKQRLAEIKRRAAILYGEELIAYKKMRLKDINYLYELSPYEFEIRVLEMFSNLGYSVQATPFSNDRGKDGIAYLDNKKYLIECKRYNRNASIGRPMLQKFFAAIYEEKAQCGYFVTTSFFASTAYEYAKNNKIILVNGYKLVEMMIKAYPEEIKYFKAMCLECGDIVVLKLDSNKIQSMQCKNGHIVTFNRP